MGWGELHGTGVGTTQQVEDAQRAFDAVGVPFSGSPLALRAIAAAGYIDRLLQTPTEVAGELLQVSDRDPLHRPVDICFAIVMLGILIAAVLVKAIRWLG